MKSILHTITKKEFRRFIMGYMNTSKIEKFKYVAFKKDYIIFNVGKKIKKSNSFAMIHTPSFCHVQNFHTKNGILYGTFVVKLKDMEQIVDYIEYWNRQPLKEQQRVEYDLINLITK
jgi:hypothetical protein